MKCVNKMKRKISSSEGGFTLIELLIVIAIIGILAAIAIPQFSQYKVRSYDADAKSNLHNIYLACKAYWADNGPIADCGRIEATRTAYGYLQSQNIVMTAASVEETVFAATANNIHSTNTFSIDSNGAIN